MVAFPVRCIFRGFLALAVVAAVAVAAPFVAPATAQEQMGSPHPAPVRLKRPGQPDIVLPAMNPARGRVYFATRGCVICHKVNGIGGSLAPALDGNSNGDIDVFDFVTRMWRGARSMVALQESLFSENIDLSPDELADIIAFVYDPAERRKFSEADIPQYIRDYMILKDAVPRR